MSEYLPNSPKTARELVLLETPRVVLQNWRCNFSAGASKYDSSNVVLFDSIDSILFFESWLQNSQLYVMIGLINESKSFRLVRRS